MKLITKIRKAAPENKTKVFQDADLLRHEAEDLVIEMILSLPGYYKLHDRKYGTNLKEKVTEVYGWMPAMFITEKMLLGMQAINEKKVYASFTLGLDAIQIKK